MTFLDMQHMNAFAGAAPSPDGRWLVYTVSMPDWQEAKRQSDIWLMSPAAGVASARRLTYTKQKNETAPQWLRDGSAFLFLSNRDAAGDGTQDQLYLMRPDGGEARRITDAKDGVTGYALTRDGRWLIYVAGKAGERQLYRLPVAGIDSAQAEPLTKQAAGVGQWQITKDSRRVYFVTADTLDAEEKERREKKFTVNVRNPETPLSSLWALDMDPVKVTRLTNDTSITVSGFSISDDGRWVGFRGTAADRYKRTITESFLNSDLYLLETATGRIERITDNEEVAETNLSFSPDGRWVAFSAPDDLTRYTMRNTRVYLRAPGARGGEWRKLGSDFDGDVRISFWSPDARTIFFNAGIRATQQVMALDVASGAVTQVTQEKAAVMAFQDQETGTTFINYADPRTPPTLYLVPSLARVGERGTWQQLTDLNPQVRGFALGEEEEISWTSTDGSPVAGVLVRPVGFQPDRRYPLIVAIHGGPASADVLGFNGGYGSQVYAGAGYVVLKPNYRGSTNYGEKHKTDIVGNYFPPGFDDIMTGVDHLIAEGIVDPERMGVLGWSAGGHWSNWILTHTDRFKAISSGAGTANWVSMYAQSDMQRVRQFYFGDRLPYEDYEPYWQQSPLRYIRNAKTPTMIHVVEGDPRVPSPQSVELHMALRKLGVATELFVYPGSTHGIPDPRNQLVKAVSEMAWMDYYVRGTGEKFSWRDVLRTLAEPKPEATTADRP
ncbi:MAG TPA: S9 family peptidase [Longimicrobiales bacterium]|nr:S9 family peptidase [Longimicrobiales bacterium]